MGRVFHSMENIFADFPHNGKNVSTLWKTGRLKHRAEAWR